jgi:hypothetical protein
VTADSVQAELTGDTVTDPAVFTRFTYRRSVALETCAAVVPEGSTERSNCSSDV